MWKKLSVLSLNCGVFLSVSRQRLCSNQYTAIHMNEGTLPTIGEQASLLPSLLWLDNNSAFLITDPDSQKKKQQENDFTHEESETMALQILEWISISKLVVETV